MCVGSHAVGSVAAVGAARSRRDSGCRDLKPCSAARGLSGSPTHGSRGLGAAVSGLGSVGGEIDSKSIKQPVGVAQSALALNGASSPISGSAHSPGGLAETGKVDVAEATEEPHTAAHAAEAAEQLLRLETRSGTQARASAGFGLGTLFPGQDTTPSTLLCRRSITLSVHAGGLSRSAAPRQCRGCPNLELPRSSSRNMLAPLQGLVGGATEALGLCLSSAARPTHTERQSVAPRGSGLRSTCSVESWCASLCASSRMRRHLPSLW